VYSWPTSEVKNRLAVPQQVRMVVKRQHYGAVPNHDLIRDMRNSYKVQKQAAAH